MKSLRLEPLSWMPLVVVLSVLWALPSFVGCEALRASEENGAVEENGAGVGTPESIWESFVEFVHEQGRGADLEVVLPSVTEPSDSTDSETTGDASGSAPEPASRALPDLRGSDPVLAVLFRQSKALVAVDALLREPAVGTAEGQLATDTANAERPEAPDERRARRVTRALERLDRDAADEANPYLRAYHEYYGVRWALEQGQAAEVVEPLQRLLASKYFLPKRSARRALAKAYRALGEDTLAVLELQFFRLDLTEADASEARWAREQLREIREGHDGPVHDCVDREQTISVRLADRQVGAETQTQQRQVEDILEKVAQLLEEQASRCPFCQQAQCASTCKKCGSCMKSGLCTPQQCNAGSGKGKALVKMPGQGQKRDQKQRGDPKGNRPDEKAAERSQLAAGKGKDAELRESVAKDAERWGEINLRGVSASLRELWGKVPPSYRPLVAKYFEDINDLGDDDLAGDKSAGGDAAGDSASGQ